MTEKSSHQHPALTDIVAVPTAPSDGAETIRVIEIGDTLTSDPMARSSPLEEHLNPPDSYKDGVYWADLPYSDRVRWVNQQHSTEAWRELRVVGAMTKRDPLSPVRAYFRRYVVTGMGLFVEGYTLFSIGNLSPLFKAVYPACWSKHETCNKLWIDAIDYLEIAGIIVGQIIVGIEGDWVGRKFGLVQDALVMFFGTIMLTAMWGTSLQSWTILYAWALFIYGIGVGGEYPMTSTRALEIKEQGPEAMRNDRLHRGRNVSLSFLMQGWGQLINQLLLIVLLLIFNSGATPPYTAFSAQWTFRLQFAFVGFWTLWLLYYRIYKIDDPDRVLRRAKKRAADIDGAGKAVNAYDVESLRLTVQFFWHRLIGTAGAWFCNDFFFYGNKIFAGVFIKIIAPNASVVTGWYYNLINIGVSLVGYYLAALLIDHKFYGRKRMQIVGFIMDFILFVIAAALFDTLVKPGAGIRAFQFIYFFSSFWNQFGPNSTTFLLAAEVYPTAIRSTAHGFSAAVGKLGALAPAILYNYIDNHTKFWVVSWFGLLGCALTVLFVPDTTGLDLREQERYWDFVRSGREEEYHGIAVHPRHLSFYENVVLKKSRHYDSVLDRKARYDELRSAYETSSRQKYAEDVKVDVSGVSSYSEDDQDYYVHDDVRRYFDAQKLSGSGSGSSGP